MENKVFDAMPEDMKKRFDELFEVRERKLKDLAREGVKSLRMFEPRKDDLKPQKRK